MESSESLDEFRNSYLISMRSVLISDKIQVPRYIDM
jgi:hypothetical protein